MSEILVTGSLALDDIVTPYGGVTNAVGGSAVHFAAGASLFAPVRIIGVVGEDFPRGELAFLEKRGVNLDAVTTVKGGRTFRWAGEYEKNMNIRRTTNLELNVFEGFVPTLDAAARAAKYVFLGNIDPDLQLGVLDQLDAPAFVAADTIECYIESKPDRFREVISRIDLLVINDSEARLLTGETEVLAAAKTLRSWGAGNVIVKKGEHGSVLLTPDSLFIVPAYPLETVIDPTGAGDSYAGGLLGYCAGRDVHDSPALHRAVVYGGIVASFMVGGFGFEGLRELDTVAIEDRFSRFAAMTSL